jgi:hypothetical protein
MMLSLLECLWADGSVNVGIYPTYLHQRRDRDQLIVNLLDAFDGGNWQSFCLLCPWQHAWGSYVYQGPLGVALQDAGALD